MQSLHRGDFRVFGQFDGLFPACHPALVARVACGTEAIAVVRAAVHQVPVAHARALIVCIVEVGIAQTVAEFVADGADSVDFPRRHVVVSVVGSRLQLVAAGVGIDPYTVEFDGSHVLAVVLCRGKGPLVRIDRFLVAAVGFARTGIKHIHLIHFAIAVPVVVGEIHVGISHPTRLHNHSSGVHIFVVLIVAAVVFSVVGQGVGTHDVEIQLEKALALGKEIVIDRAHELVVHEIRFVGDAVIERLVVGGLKFHVGVVNKDDEAFFLTDEIARQSCFLGHLALCTAQVGLCAAFLGVFLDVEHVDLLVERFVLHFPKRPAVGRAPKMAVFIAHEASFYRCSVAESQQLLLTRFRRNCAHRQHHHQEHKARKNSRFHRRLRFLFNNPFFSFTHVDSLLLRRADNLLSLQVVD